MMANTASSRFKSFMLHILSCCDKSEPPLQIGYPTDFRREDISMPGLTEAEQTLIREKAIADAQRMVAAQSYSIPPPSQCTLPHHSPVLPQHQSTIDRVRRHARKLSAKMGYGGSPVDDEYASRPIVYSGSEERVGPGSLGVRDDAARGPLLAAQSRDSITLHGGSEGSLQSDYKDGLRL